MLEEAEADWWLPRSGHWIIMEGPDIMRTADCIESRSPLDAICRHWLTLNGQIRSLEIWRNKLTEGDNLGNAGDILGR